MHNVNRGAVSSLNCINIWGRSVSIIRAFRFLSASKQPICRDLNHFRLESPESSLKWNRDLLNRIFIVQIESPRVFKSRFKSQSWLGSAGHCIERLVVEVEVFSCGFAQKCGRWVRSRWCPDTSPRSPPRRPANSIRRLRSITRH